ncbi:MAG: hypothetical protein KatS3mg077_1149 [Candidatus Binatia bacterium]|nr:MAG: hypothetical protein KatS3mg077_1149 [Candidatus Binatia bacterium]
MTSRLSSDALNQLTPVLGSLARLVMRGTQVSDGQLHTLLLGAGLEDDPAALEELRRWGKLLAAVRRQPTQENRHATVEALMLRGLPEASVLLAVDTVASQATGAAVSSSHARRVTASVASLNLGLWPPGKEAVAEFEVQGGPGQVVVESEQVRVTPRQFEAGATRIRVEVAPLSEGVLWTTLRLLTATETLEVPVVVQWMGSLAVPVRAGAVVVAPDGSGDFRSLEEAVQRSEPGTTLFLKAGSHRLAYPLVIDKPLTLNGEGIESTYIVCGVEECVVQYSGNGLFSASDIAFVHEGTSWGEVVRASNGEVSFIRCRFTGAVSIEGGQRGGSGLWLYGTTRGRVANCEATGNQIVGIRVSERAQPRLEGNTCEGNKGPGIAYFGSAAGVACQNTCAGNGEGGIYVGEQAQPRLEANTCQGNKGVGIAYLGSASGVVRRNTCEGNGDDGIYVASTASPLLTRNRCRGNKGEELNDQRR